MKLELSIHRNKLIFHILWINVTFHLVTHRNGITFQAFHSLSAWQIWTPSIASFSCFSDHNFATVSFWQIEDNCPIRSTRFAYIFWSWAKIHIWKVYTENYNERGTNFKLEKKKKTKNRKWHKAISAKNSNKFHQIYHSLQLLFNVIRINNACKVSASFKVGTKSKREK